MIFVKAKTSSSGYVSDPMVFLALTLGFLLAVPSVQAAPEFDTAQIHRIYMDGEFEKAIKLIETALASGSVASHVDSVFAFKHLGVMYASDMIYMIFKNIQEEVAITRGRPKRDDEGPAPNPSPRKKRTWPYWVGGTVALGAGVALTTYILMDREPRPGTDHVVAE